MSQSGTIAGDVTPTGERKGSDRRTVDDGADAAEFLELLADDPCRSILSVTGDDARSAAEIAETCDLPQSTTYRKLERLTDTGLLAERIRIRNSGSHLTEYRRTVESVHVPIEDDGIELRLSECDRADNSSGEMAVVGD